MKQGWTYKKFGEVCDIYNGNSINADYKKQHFYGATGGLPFIATKDVSSLGIIDYNNGVRIPNFEEFKVAPANSVFICAEGGSAGKKFAYVEQNVCFGNKLFCLNPIDRSLAGRFLYYFIQSDIFKEQFYALLTGLIGGVSAKKFQTIEIPIPPLPEQQRIVSRLDSAFAHIDELKANAEKQVNEARALFQKALSKAMEPKEGWEEKTLGEVCDFRSGFAFKSSKFTKSGEPIIRISDIQNEEIDESNLVYFDPKSYKEDLSKFLIYPDDILIAMSGGTTGKLGLNTSNRKFYLNQRVGVFRENKKYLDHRFLFYFLHTKSEESLRIAAGAAQPNLSTAQINSFLIPLAPLAEQHRIVSRLDALSKNVKALEENQRKVMAECDALKQALLRKVFE